MMKLIEALEDQINEEMHDSGKYIKCALKHKEDHKELADLYYWLSQEEMAHAEKLHKMVVGLIEDYKKKEGEPPAEMLAVYNYIHKKEIEEAAEIKLMWAMYKD